MVMLGGVHSHHHTHQFFFSPILAEYLARNRPKSIDPAPAFPQNV